MQQVAEVSAVAATHHHQVVNVASENRCVSEPAADGLMSYISVGRLIVGERDSEAGECPQPAPCTFNANSFIDV